MWIDPLNPGSILDRSSRSWIIAKPDLVGTIGDASASQGPAQTNYGTGNCDSAESYFPSQSNSNNSTERSTTTNGKRRRDDEEGQDQSRDDSTNPKQPRTLLSSPRNQEDNSKFACPYRKRNPRRYCVRDWRSCALTPLETVARVKYVPGFDSYCRFANSRRAHLYRHHRIFPCQRCKKLFKNQGEVSLHLNEAQSCKRNEIIQPDGLIIEVVEKLRCKKKSHPNQTEEGRWREIYQILFPNEIVPSPCK